MTPDRTRLSPRVVAGEMLRVYRRHWRFLVPAAIIVLIPQSIGDALLEGFEVDHLRSALDFAELAGGLLTVAVNLLGQAVYAGLAAAAVVDWRAGQPLPPISALIRAMPIGRLIVLDVVLTLVFSLGFLLLVVPGLLAITYLFVSPAVLKLEHLGVRESLARSMRIVRGQAIRVFPIVVGSVFLSELAVQLVAAPFHDVWVLAVVNLAAEGVFQPIEGLAVALVAIHLLELRGEAPEPTTMARSLVSEHD